MGHRSIHNPPLDINKFTRFRRKRSSNNPAGPSSTLLHLIATLATSSSVDASPLTSNNNNRPSFIHFDNSEIHIPIPRSNIPPGYPLLPPPIERSLGSGIRTTIPDKYEQGQDGLWYKVDGYTLYGSTICSTCQPTSGTANNEASTQTPSISTPLPSPDILDTLPLGWKPSATNRRARTTVISSISLALAIFICVFMIVFVIWRKSKLRFFKKDEEMRLRRRRRTEADIAHREVKAKQKLWDRATARWKANVRYMARQRNGKRPITRRPSSQMSSTTPPPQDPTAETTVPPTSPLSTSVSRDLPCPTQEASPPRRVEQETVSDSPNPTSPSDPNHNTSPSSADPETLTVPPSSPTYLSPPTYQRATRLPPIRIPIETSHSNIDLQPSPVASSSSLAADSPAAANTPAADASPDVPPYHTAHVAVDDKAILAQMASLASAPPPVPDSDAQVSAPVWDDTCEEIAETDPHISRTSLPSLNHPPAPLFPPPPSHGKLAVDPYYDYDYFPEDLEHPGLETEPSAPPFEEVYTGAPPLNMAPSAPPLNDPDVVPGSPNEGLEGNLDGGLGTSVCRSHLTL